MQVSHYIEGTVVNFMNRFTVQIQRNKSKEKAVGRKDGWVKTSPTYKIGQTDSTFVCLHNVR
jgi:hypothetical protein